MGIENIRNFVRFVLLFAVLRLGVEVSQFVWIGVSRGWPAATPQLTPLALTIAAVHLGLLISAIGFLKGHEWARNTLLASALLGVIVICYELTFDSPLLAGDQSATLAATAANYVGAAFYFSTAVVANMLSARSSTFKTDPVNQELGESE